MPKTREEVLDRIDRSGGPDACWPWTGYGTGTGYGAVAFDGKTWRAHRLVWTFERGAIPAGLNVCHRCDFPLCCNPAHLWLGTQAENLADMREKGRHSVDPARRYRGGYWSPEARQAANDARRAGKGSLRGTANPGAKLTDEQVEAIRAVPPGWGVIARLAREYGVSHMCISRVRRGLRYPTSRREA